MKHILCYASHVSMQAPFNYDEKELIKYLDSLRQTPFLGINLPVALIFPRYDKITGEFLQSTKDLRKYVNIKYFEQIKEFTEEVHQISIVEGIDEIKLNNAQEKIMDKLAEKYWPDDRPGNDYFRVSGIKLEDKKIGGREYQSVTINLSPTKWRFMKIRENIIPNMNNLNLESDEMGFLRDLASNYVLNGLGVRTFLFSKDGYLLLQTKKGKKKNNTYGERLEAASAGYLDSDDHRVEGKLSLEKCGLNETIQEAGIAKKEIDNITFEQKGIIGMTRNSEKGHLDIFMFLKINTMHDNIEMSGSDRVEKLEWISVLPDDRNSIFKKFDGDTKHDFENWVPQAPISLVPTLNYVLPRYIESFKKNRRSGY